MPGGVGGVTGAILSPPPDSPLVVGEWSSACLVRQRGDLIHCRSEPSITLLHCCPVHADNVSLILGSVAAPKSVKCLAWKKRGKLSENWRDALSREMARQMRPQTAPVLWCGRYETSFDERAQVIWKRITSELCGTAVVRVWVILPPSLAGALIKKRLLPAIARSL
jgi:hypothetical protein